MLYEEIQGFMDNTKKAWILCLGKYDWKIYDFGGIFLILFF